VLSLIATPIGNLRDISERAKEALSSCDLLLCEDTRHSAKLFQALGLKSPKRISLHKFNEASREKEIIPLLKEGSHVALISDAGTPGISDPGSALVARCHEEKIPVTIIPGPCAFASAYALSGSLSERVQFIGFLPKKEKERRSLLHELLHYPGASVCYESPKRVKETLSLASEIAPSWRITLVRELTKLHEEVLSMDAQSLHDSLDIIRGEYTLIFHLYDQENPVPDEALIEQVRATRASFSCSLKEAVEIVAQQNRISQRNLYQLCIHQK
jgi:16S rRNA (cytidine1402-2'-O)-methyltransferase